MFSGKTQKRKLKLKLFWGNFQLIWINIYFSVYAPRTKLEGDTSIMTYRGHVVIKTLVRCRFSPVETTGQRYIYTGCGLGSVIST